MKVQIQTTVQVDAEVPVSVEDIQFALSERLEEANRDPESRFILNSFVNCVYQCLLAMNDEFVQRINPKQRNAIGDELEKIACRFRDRTG